ncbi:MAG: hypothetical protein EBU90_20705 [Proteobacteria bacterium]|nr:hypothetical protein [Pseudomonadota bacterium]
MNKQYTTVKVISLLLVLTFFQGCDWFTKKEVMQPYSVAEDSSLQEESDQVLFSLHGKPVITREQFQKHLQTIAQANPQVRSMIQVPQMQYNIFSGMMSQELLKEWAKEQGITEKKEYQQDFAMMTALIEYELAYKYLQEEINQSIKVTAADIKAYYDAHKDSTPDLIIHPGGVKALAVAFEKQEEADAFTQKELLKNFQQVAQSAGYKVIDFGLVNRYSVGVDKAIKERLVAVKTVPSVMRIKTEDNKFLVCLVTAKEAAQYRLLQEVETAIEQNLKNEKMKIVFGQKMEALKIVYKAQEDSSYFNAQKTLIAQSEIDDVGNHNVTSRVL